jgi:hypothetical protein
MHSARENATEATRRLCPSPAFVVHFTAFAV